jgi:hypothetical protein
VIDLFGIVKVWDGRDVVHGDRCWIHGHSRPFYNKSVAEIIFISHVIDHLQAERDRSRSDPRMVPVSLAPRPGFCIKSTTLSPGAIHPTNPSLLETAIPIPPHRKVFVNIAWDANVPPPPEGSEDAIQNAMQGEDLMDESSNPNGWYVPVIVSNPREVMDKGTFHPPLPDSGHPEPRSSRQPLRRIRLRVPYVRKIAYLA